MTIRSARVIFYTAAIFNWVAAVILLPASGLAGHLGAQPIGNTLFEQGLLVAIVVFGIGYWMVGRNPADNRDIVKLGVLGKVGLVALAIYHYFLVKDIPFGTLALGSGDVIYSALFVSHLLSGPRERVSGGAREKAV